MMPYTKENMQELLKQKEEQISFVVLNKRYAYQDDETSVLPFLCTSNKEIKELIIKSIKESLPDKAHVDEIDRIDDTGIWEWKDKSLGGGYYRIEIGEDNGALKGYDMECEEKFVFSYKGCSFL